LTRPSCGSCALSQLTEHPLRVSLKCEPQLAEQLRPTYSAVIPGYHVNKLVTRTPRAPGGRARSGRPWAVLAAAFLMLTKRGL